MPEMMTLVTEMQIQTTNQGVSMHDLCCECKMGRLSSHELRIYDKAYLLGGMCKYGL